MVISNDDESHTLTREEILDLVDRVFGLLKFDIQWDLDETVDGLEWDKMSIHELAKGLAEDFEYKMIDEYLTSQEENDE